MSKTIAQQLNVTEFPFEIKDKVGRVIYLEDSDNFWSKREYDSHGYLIFYEDSDGYSSKREYDSQGNQVYYENSDGKIIDRRPKETNRPMKTPMQEFMEHMESHQYFIGNDLLSKYKELLDKEKQELKDAFDRGASARAFDTGATAWVSGRTFDDYYNKTHKDKEQ